MTKAAWEVFEAGWPAAADLIRRQPEYLAARADDIEKAWLAPAIAGHMMHRPECYAFTWMRRRTPLAGMPEPYEWRALGGVFWCVDLVVAKGRVREAVKTAIADAKSAKILDEGERVWIFRDRTQRYGYLPNK